MAKDKNKKQEDLASKYISEFKAWRNELSQYWEEIDKRQEMYEGYKRDAELGMPHVSLNTAFAMVESMVAKANESTMAVTVKARGQNFMEDFESWVSSTVENALEDPDVAMLHMPFRKVREEYMREFLVKGNAVAAVEWCYKTSVINGKKKVIADNPYSYVLPLKSVIFNPTRTLATSGVYYIEKFVSYSDLKKGEYNKEKDKGLYNNLPKIKELSEKEGKMVDAEDQFFFSGEKKFSRKVEPIRILERWDGADLTVIALIKDEGVVIREANDPMKIGRAPLFPAMNYVVEGRPYAYGEIDAIYEAVMAQDAIVSQNIELVNRSLKPNAIVDPLSGIDLDALMLIMTDGGVTYGDPDKIKNIPIQLPPAQAFTTIEQLQQAIERAGRFSPYSTGVPNQVSDKTAGTASGIQALQSAAEPNFQVKMDAIKDFFLTPLANTVLKMVANLMSPKDIRYSLLEGKSQSWVAATKGILMGAPKLQDFVISGVIDEEDLEMYTTVPDEYGELAPIPGALSMPVFDVEWLVRVDLDNQSAADQKEKTQQKLEWIQLCKELGVPLDSVKVAMEIGREIDDWNPEEMFAMDQIGSPDQVAEMPQPGMDPMQGMPQGMPPMQPQMAPQPMY